MYDGWLLKIGDWIVPNAYIQPETYEVGVNKEEVWSDKNYYRERLAIYSERKNAAVEFNTAKNFMLSDVEVGQIQEALEGARVKTGDLNKDAYRLKFYDPSTDEYILDKYFTLEPLKYTIHHVGKHHVYYNPISFSFEEVSVIDG